MRATIFIAALLTAGVVGLIGCSNSSGPSPSGYLTPSSPENVLANLGRAYGERDLDEYLGCMSEDFKFHFTEADQQGPNPLPPWFYKSDERQVHENMFGGEDGVESIVLTLTVASVETIPGGDRCVLARDIVIIQADVEVRVNLHGDMAYLTTNPQDFYFRTVAGSEEREGRDLWEIFKWDDREVWEKGSASEESSWGAIKHLFLESLSEPSRRTSPDDVINQLKTAYVAMDTLNYLDCLSEDFSFFTNEGDQQDPQDPLPEQWYKLDERTMHRNMFTGPDAVESITLTLTDITRNYVEGDPDDPMDDTWIYLESVDLLVNLYGNQAYLATGPSEFWLGVDQDETGPYGELMWEVYMWFELSGSGRGDVAGRVEDASWGGIKSMFW